MNYRRWAVTVESSLIGLILFVHLAIVAAGPTLRIEIFGAVARDALPFAQVVLLLAWVAFGPGAVWVRWTALPALSIAGGLAWAWMWHDLSDQVNANRTGLLIAAACCAGGAVIGLRLAGLAIRPIGSGYVHREKPAQFSIRSLIAITTLIAVAICGLETLRPIITGHTERLSAVSGYVYDTVEDVFRPTTIRMLVLGAVIAGSGVAGLWIVLRPGAIWVRLLGTAIGLPLLAVYLTDLYGNNFSLRVHAVPMTMVLGAVATITGVSVLPLRLWNYRLSRQAVMPLAGTQPGPAVPRIDVNAPFAESKLAPGCCASSEISS